MKELVMDALMDTLRMVPFLLIIYFLIEFIELRLGETIQARIRKAGHAGPLIGALFGCVPQCGFSVVGSALYTRRIITTGTLLAVFLSTSDEAVPVILAHTARWQMIIPLLLTKIIVALVVGYAIDVCTRRAHQLPLHPEHVSTPAMVGEASGHPHSHSEHAGEDEAHHAHDDTEDIHVEACCGHHVAEKRFTKELWWHPLSHTAHVSLFVFLATLAINYLIFITGEEHLSKALLGGSLWQPVITAIVGLIPNCAASVAITEMYLKQGITFGAAISGLCSSAGLGLLVLLKENHNTRDTIRIFLLLLGSSILAGVVIQILFH